LDRIPSDDPAWIDIWNELEAFRRGEREPEVEPGEIGLHLVPIAGGKRRATLCINRRVPDILRIELIKLVRLR